MLRALACTRTREASASHPSSPSSLSALADECLRNYAFGGAAAAIYDFFLKELCDYYLELLKTLMAVDGSAAADSAAPADVAAREAASAAGGDVRTAQRLGRATLRVCLETGFRLLHPMMPFVTEELWQRLPGRGLPTRAGAGAAADPESIVIAPYPTARPALSNAAIEADFAAFRDVVTAGRVLRADADIAPSKPAAFFVVAASADAARVVNAQRTDVCTLLRASALSVVADAAGVPDGCSASVVNESVTVYLQLKGLVDPVVEIAKLEKKSAKLLKEADDLRRKAAADGYAKMPDAVKAAEAERLAAAEKQLATLGALVQQYRSWQ
jgi:valyl-tRNA synthetase